jgi:hypothetical protein
MADMQGRAGSQAGQIRHAGIQFRAGRQVGSWGEQTSRQAEQSRQAGR